MNERPDKRQPVIFTIGHSTRSISEFIEIITAFAIKKVVDIRTIPRSRHNPQFNEDELRESLETATIRYLHMKGLGGLRRPRKDSQNGAWRNASFRGFADYMQTGEFEESLGELITVAGKHKTVIMCAEAVPWRCHRSLIADALLIRGVTVTHIMGIHSGREHTLTPWAEIRGGKITYPGTAAGAANGGREGESIRQ